MLELVSSGIIVPTGSLPLFGPFAVHRLRTREGILWSFGNSPPHQRGHRTRLRSNIVSDRPLLLPPRLRGKIWVRPADITIDLPSWAMNLLQCAHMAHQPPRGACSKRVCIMQTSQYSLSCQAVSSGPSNPRNIYDTTDGTFATDRVCLNSSISCVYYLLSNSVCTTIWYSMFYLIWVLLNCRPWTAYGSSQRVWLCCWSR